MTTSPGTKIGYGRISTADQSTDLQTDALRDAGCERVFIDEASGTLRDRPQLTRALDYLRPNDVLVVWRLDRLGRSLRNLIDVVQQLAERDIGLISLREAIDTTTPSGRLVLHVFASISEFERDLIVERTRAGLQAARARGRVGGRPAVLTGEKLRVARQMYDSREYTVTAIADTLGISRATVYRHLQRSA